MVGIDLKPELEEMVKLIGYRNSYSGNKISDSIMKMFTVEISELHDGILVPYWLGVLERGRGPRKSNVDTGLYKRIKKWMAKRNMFKSKTAKGRDNEAKQMTWYINHYGNKQFNRGNPIFVDIYTSVRKQTIEKINKKFSDKINQITYDIL
jgi:hypothetical protein